MYIWEAKTSIPPKLNTGGGETEIWTVEMACVIVAECFAKAKTLL